ncbi:MAG: hemolysin family protein [candidate division Zixibacteria bacterium]|nr:hemolysin family protein [candidate division Zixibacteria bacterium]
MFELACFLIIAGGYLTGYLVSLYSLAVYVNPDEVKTLFDGITASRRSFLSKLALDTRAFVQIAIVYKAFVLILITTAAIRILGYLSSETGLNALLWYGPGLVLVWLSYIFVVEYFPRRSSRRAINPKMLKHLWFIAAVYAFCRPIIMIYRRSIERIRDAIPVTEEEKEEIVERAIETLADEAGIGETIVEDEEKEMIGQIFLLDQTVVREIMIPRIDITAIERQMSFRGIRELVLKDGHSRYPVFDETIDKIAGLLYVKDLFSNMPEPGESFVIEKYLRQPYFVPETKIIGELLKEFKNQRLHIAIVVDEYGGVAGLVTLEDIIEEIFGEIQDEHDAEEAEFLKLPDGSYQVNANLLVEELQDNLDTDYAQGDYDTVGGLIYDLVGSVPSEGQKIRWHQLEFEIVKIEGQRILSVRVKM